MFCVASCPVHAGALSFDKEDLEDGVRKALRIDESSWITEKFENVEGDSLYIVGKQVQHKQYMDTVKVKTYSRLVYGLGDQPLLGVQTDFDFRYLDQNFQFKMTTAPLNGDQFMLFTFSHKF